MIMITMMIMIIITIMIIIKTFIQDGCIQSAINAGLLK